MLTSQRFVGCLAKDGLKLLRLMEDRLCLQKSSIGSEFSLASARFEQIATAMRHRAVYEVRPRKDKRGVDLISDVLPFGRLRFTGSR